MEKRKDSIETNKPPVDELAGVRMFKAPSGPVRVPHTASSARFADSDDDDSDDSDDA